MKQWNFLQPDPEIMGRIERHLGCSPIISALLVNRGIHSEAQAEQFLDFSFQRLTSPDSFTDMDKAARRIYHAITHQQHILIFGDYDVDGITGTALLHDFLKTTGALVSCYIPHRETEGYGLQMRHINNDAFCRDIDLIITVDCGSSSHEVMPAARQAGIDIIVTDHHAVSDAIPEALAVINPKRKDCSSLAENLAGVGVVYFLIIYLRKYLRDMGFWISRNEPNLKNYCDLVALGTIADLVPLTCDNRIFVKNGMDMLSTGKRAGIRSLIEISGIKAAAIDAEDVAFKLAPRLNAAGRMEHADTALHLLLESDVCKAKELAQSLNALNTQRKYVEQQIFDEIRQRICAHPEQFNNMALIIAGTGWAPGVLGIVASRLVQLYFLPVILIAVQNGVGKGSARSIPGFDIFQGIHACADCLIRYGGHALAGGLEIDADKIPEFQTRFNRIADSEITGEQRVVHIGVDRVLNLEDISEPLISDMDLLKPYGMGNPEPVFYTNHVHVASSKIVGNNTRRMILKPVDRSSHPGILAVQFNCDPRIPTGQDIREMVYRLRWNYWNGSRTMQILVEDAKFSLQSDSSESIMRFNTG